MILVSQRKYCYTISIVVVLGGLLEVILKKCSVHLLMNPICKILEMTNEIWGLLYHWLSKVTLMFFICGIMLRGYLFPLKTWWIPLNDTWIQLLSIHSIPFTPLNDWRKSGYKRQNIGTRCNLWKTLYWTWIVNDLKFCPRTIWILPVRYDSSQNNSFRWFQFL